MKKMISEKEMELLLNYGGENLLYNWAVEQICDGNEDCYELAVKFYHIAAEKGHALALNNLGALYSEGRFVEKDTEKAMEYYTIAAEKGSAEACCNLGYYYLYGRNGEVDTKKAFEFFSRGAMLGNDANCAYKLGDMYMHGSYVERNPSIAFGYYVKALEIAREFGCSYETDFMPDLYYRIGKCLLKGEGTEKDVMSAEKYLEDALIGYEEREYDGYGYVEKRIAEIKDMLK